MHKLTAIISLSLALSSICPPAAFSQRSGDPNLGHFYMARQQVQITDDSPIIMNRPGEPGAAGSGRMNGSMPNRPLPLPRAGWQSFSPTQPPGYASGLPKVHSGMPPSAIPQMPGGNKAKAGVLAGGGKSKTKAKPSVASSPTSVSAYKPYATYNPQPAAGANAQQSTTNVRGSVLHWARHAHRSN